jgi:Bacteriophage abortive infection AbiH
MAVVAIIGNGFDINLGMPTGYQDFLASTYFPSINDERSLAFALRAKADAMHWFDIEEELAIYASSNVGRKTLKQEYYDLREALSQYLNSLPFPTDSKSTHAHQLIQKIAGEKDLKIFNFNYTNSVKYLLQDAG